MNLNKKITAKGIAERVMAGQDPLEIPITKVTTRRITTYEQNVANEYFGDAEGMYYTGSLGGDGIAMVYYPDGM